MEPRHEPTFFEQLTGPNPVTYDQEVIIDFLHRGEGEALQKTWNRRHPNHPCILLHGKQFLAANDICPLKTNSKIRIYMIVHSNGTRLSDTADGKGSIDVEKLSTRLANYIGDLSCVLNLISCGAGGGPKKPLINNEKSVAATIHANLLKLAQRDIPVIARTHIVANVINKEKNKLERTTPNLNVSWQTVTQLHLFYFLFSRHRQDRSKVIFTVDNKGHQIILNAYVATWRNRVFKILGELLEKEKDDDVKRLLKHGLEEFRLNNAENIYRTIKETLANNYSILNRDGLEFPGAAKARKKLSKAIKEWENVRSSPAIFREPFKP